MSFITGFLRLVWRTGFAVPYLLLLLCTTAVLAQEPEHDLLLVEVRLDQTLLSSAIPAYDVGPHTLLPLGELARLLSLAIQTRPREGTANGFILTEARSFGLHLNDARVSLAGVNETFDPGQVLAQPDDLYVSIELLERWLPIELNIERSSLVLHVIPLEVLPLQAHLQRSSVAEKMTSNSLDDVIDYPHVNLPYRLWSPPFLDQSLVSEFRRQEDGTTEFTGNYTAHMTGDLLGLESSIFYNESSGNRAQKLRVTFGRHDPDGTLLGPLRARTVQFGSFSTTSMENIARGISGRGVNVSNRPLERSTQFDRQSFEGDLTPGWDVELFYNNALIGYQSPDSEGRYRFEDLPLNYGPNEFELVFHGPLGETRVERYRYSLAESMVAPGEFQYNLAEHRDEQGRTRTVALFDLGVSRALSTNAGFISVPVDDINRQYMTAGLRTFWNSFSLSADLVKNVGGGSLVQLGVKTGVRGFTLDGSRIFLNDFYSEVFNNTSDPSITQDTLRVSGSIPISARVKMPITIQALRQEYASGRVDNYLSTRVSAYIWNTAITKTLNWSSYDGNEEAHGSLGISRRFRNTSLRGQINYELGAEAKVSVLTLSSDMILSDGYRWTSAIAHDLTTPETRYSTGFTKSLGKFGLGVSVSYLDTGEFAFSLQVFVAMGRDSVRSDWLLGARSLADTGAASMRAFLDQNNDGVMNAGDTPVPGVGFTVNGRKHRGRTDEAGLAHLDQIPVRQRVNVGVDTATLEDPRWVPAIPGRSLIPRRGRTAEISIPLSMSTEIDGTVYLYEDNLARAIGGLELELLDKNNTVVSKTTSSWDGFYIIPGVIAGEYQLQISPEQLQRLGLKSAAKKYLYVAGDGEFLNGIDFWVKGI